MFGKKSTARSGAQRASNSFFGPLHRGIELFAALSELEHYHGLIAWL
jgi:hypothetical protein